MHRLSRRDLIYSSGALLASSSALVSADSVPRPNARAIVRLNYNESPYGASRRARAALLGLGDRAWKYSYEELPELRRDIARHEGVQPENVFVSEGSGEILKLVALIHGAAGREIVVARPTFPMLPQYAVRRGAAVIWVDVNRQQGHDLPAMQAAVSEATSIVYVCNPNNPTGTLTAADELRAFIGAMPARTLVLVDEAYIDYVPEPAQATVVNLVKSGAANLLVSRSFSKIHGLAGLRVGYGIARPEIIAQLEVLRFSIPNQAGIAAARASLGDAAFCAGIRRKVDASRRYCAELFTALNLHHTPTSTNFMAFDSGSQSTDFVEFARQRGVMVAPIYEPLDTWVRVSMGRLEDMKIFGQTLRAFLAHA